MDPLASLRQAAGALSDQLVAWRRDFHRHPELGFTETRTAGIVADHLRSLGLEVTTGVGKTGVVAIIEGDGPPVDGDRDEPPTVLLRFDMDALPIQEETGLPYASENPGVMHACGHDGHTAIGMGVAQLLVQHRERLPGRVKLVFQPAEEGLGGADAMIQDGVLDAPRPAASFGLHLWNRLPVHQTVVQEGPLWANAGIFSLHVHGQGGHGAMPHETVDATLVASQIVVAWQSIVARNIDPAQTAVLTVGAFQSGGPANVIAEEATLRGTIRSFDPGIDAQLRGRMQEVAENVCRAFGATCELDFSINIPATINSSLGAAVMQRVAAGIVGDAQIAQIAPMMVGEDMSEFLNRAPGCFILVGADPRPESSRSRPGPHHSPTFDFDERMLPTGVALLAGAAMSYLQDPYTGKE